MLLDTLPLLVVKCVDSRPQSAHQELADGGLPGMMQLVINTRGSSLRRKAERFVVVAGEKRQQFSAQKVQSIVVATGVHLSSDVIQLASEHNVDIVFLDRRGDPNSRVWQTKMGSTATIRRRQLTAADAPEGFGFVRDWTISKLANQVQFLQELQQRRPDSEVFSAPLATINECAAKLSQLAGSVADMRGTIMGLEGTAGRAYFHCISGLMPAEYRFHGRSRQPAQDGFNAMLNYGYGVLYSLVERALILAGLDPFVGFLHTDNYNKRSLVFDMIEPFRILAERTTVPIFTGRRARKEYFRGVPGGVELSPDGRAIAITELNKRLDRTINYPVQLDAAGDTPAADRRRRKRKKKYRRIQQRVVIQNEAHAVANALLGKRDIPRIVETETIWADEAT